MKISQRVQRPPYFAHTAFVACAALCLLGAGDAPTDDIPNGLRQHAVYPYAQHRVYPYMMKGKVRLLFFWVGKDDVGGGTITLSGEPGADSSSHFEEIEVLFGSKPERVPGRHNRWGYGRERSEWESSAGATARLKRITFEGFMSRSKEKSLSEARKVAGKEVDGVFWYKGIHSVVGRGEATSEIRYFSSPDNFDYRHPEALWLGYQERLAEGPPDKQRRLENERGRYPAPYGFLTATHGMLSSIVGSYQSGADGWQSMRPSVLYVHNAGLFRLSVKDIDHARTFALRLRRPSGTARELPVTDVAEVDFRIEELGTKYKHDFTLWVPLYGPLEGIPLRIVDKPRWWLQVELNLNPDDELVSRLNRPSVARRNQADTLGQR